MQVRLFLTLAVFLPAIMQMQAQPFDTVRRSWADTLTATVTAFGQYRTEMQSLPALSVLQGAALDQYNKTSVVQAMIAVPGVRMEERSPGSYRISMRGSTLRSPFGVRNVKVYYHDIPLTDPGGNTYFNQLAFNNFSSIELAKGPAGSLYGAGTGGVILLNSHQPWRIGNEIELITGSYGLRNLLGTARWQAGGGRRQALAVSHTQQDGYRHHTRMRRTNASYNGVWRKTERYQVSGHVLISDMYYQTPGGLTLSEFEANPRQSRPRAGTLPSAAENEAAIFQRNLMAGLRQQWDIGRRWQNITTLYWAHARIRNPSIRNYETRSEPHTGLRTVFAYTQEKAGATWQWLTGAEAQQGWFATRVYTNQQGQRGALQTDDALRFATANAFTQINRQWRRWDITAGISLYENQVSIRRKNIPGAEPQRRRFANEWAPRLTLQYALAKQWQISGIISRGYSPPTVGELLPSTGNISTNLNAENGWNTEGGLRWQSSNRRWQSGLSVFHFALRQALVQRRDSTGADFFVNAGGTSQQGAEWSGQYLQVIPGQKESGLLLVRGAYTLHHFRYSRFLQFENDFSGNRMPGVPVHTFSLQAKGQCPKGFAIQSSLVATSAIWLNDANTQQAPAYQLVGVRVAYGHRWQAYAGVDNLLNQTYSLGNDINAFGGRYFNAAPARNYYLGLVYRPASTRR